MYKITTIILAIMLIPNLCWAGADFDGVDDAVNCGSAASLDQLGPVTYSFWVYNESEGGGGQGTFIGKNVMGCRFSDPGIYALRFFKSGTTGLNVISADNVVIVNTWHHVLYTWTGSTTATTVHIYVDGTEVSYVTQTNGATLNSDAVSNFIIGNIVLDSVRGVDGKMTEVAVWNMVLSASQIALLASSRLKGMPLQLADPDADGVQELVLYLPMDEVTDTASADLATFWDMSGNGNSGNPDNGAGNSGMLGSAEVILNYPSSVLGGQ